MKPTKQNISIDTLIQEALYYYGEKTSVRPDVIYLGDTEYALLAGRTKKEYATLRGNDTRETYRQMEVVQVHKKSYVGFGL